MTAIYSHFSSFKLTELPEEIGGCEDCLASGGRWVHLRRCRTCGRIACCDSSANRHASARATRSGHPIARCAEGEEDWSWCYIDNVAFVLPGR